MDATTARSELLDRMPVFHDMFRDRIDEIDYDSPWSLEIDFLVLLIWMFGDRKLVVDHFEKFTGGLIIIREGSYVLLRDDLLSYDVIVSVEKDTWLERCASLAEHIPQNIPRVNGFEFELCICCNRTMQLVNAVLDRVAAIRRVKVSAGGFHPSPGGINRFIQVLDRSSPLEYLFLKGITDGFVSGRRY